MIKSKISSYCLILSTTILGVSTTYVSAQSTTKPEETEAKTFINKINKAEQGFHLELQKFLNNLNELQLTPPSANYQYTLNVTDNGNLVQTTASPAKLKDLRTFTGATSFNRENFAYNSIFCKSEKIAKVIASEIKLVGGQLQCPEGFKITFHEVQKEALAGVQAIGREQQAYHFENTKFGKDTTLLGYAPSNTYYDYKIDLMENEQLAQVKAIPKFDNMKSYLGAVFFDSKTGFYESIICASEQPTKEISQSIKFTNGKFSCPTGFKITGINVPQVGLNSVETINRGQHAYHFEAGNFGNDIASLGLAFSNTYFDYVIDILENGNLAQIKATPKPNNVNSYIGGILFTPKTGDYESIICTSEQPTKSIPQSIKLVDGKLACPTGFTTR
jgi:hypothetical protein